jgi:gentisate 1,2-dioxygenase
MIADETTTAAPLAALHAEMAALQLEGLWRLGDEVQAERPRVATRPYVWRGADVRHVLERAGELVRHSAAAERRTVRLVNPGLPASHSATHTLAASVQLIRPGEVAPTHRHTPSAIRFVIQGHGAYTMVDGTALPMEPGDLILTPRWSWHHHGNAGAEPVIWMDGLDFPLVILLNAVFFQRHPDGIAPTAPAAEPSPLVYRWAAAYAALQAHVDAVSPYDDVLYEYPAPSGDRHTLPAMTCYLQLLRPGVHTRAHRHTSSAVYHVFRGRGYSIIDGQRLAWERGDYLALPTWAWHEHVNPGPDEAVLFSISDLPTLEKLDLYREEPHPAGYQPSP